MTTTERRKRIAYLSYSTGEFDSRTERMARSALAAGYDVIVYARWMPGLPWETTRDGYRLIRVPIEPWLAIPGLGWYGRRRIEAATAAATTTTTAAAPAKTNRADAAPVATGPAGPAVSSVVPPASSAPAAAAGGIGGALRSRTRGTALFAPLHRIRNLFRAPRRWLLFPTSIISWGIALDAVAEPADLWHGMSIGALPAIVRQKRRLGGVAVYDSRDIYMHARELARVSGLRRRLFAGAERRWAKACDSVLTVNDAYADILAKQLGVPRPPVVMNCPERWTAPVPPPDLIRAALRLPGATRIVLYQGGLLSERGIEQSMDAILQVPDAVLVLLGYGKLRGPLLEKVAVPPYRGRVFLLDAVSPSELLNWTASCDVMVMAIQPTSLNHSHTTPNKLFEAMAAGVPVVASDLPGMAAIVQATGCGVLCDPTDPLAIAAGICSIIDAPADVRAGYAARARDAAAATYNWDRQAERLLVLYATLLQAHAS